MDPAKTSSTPLWRGIDHVQVAIPPGGEPVARRFYVDVLGLAEVAKPPALAVRGGAWFEAGETRIHVGVEAEFRPAKKAHPALLIEQLVEFIRSSGLDARWSEEIPGTVRCHIDDPFGNRIELIDCSTNGPS